MDRLKSLLLSVCVLSPFLAALILPVYPFPAELKVLRLEASRARNSGEEFSEAAALENLVRYTPWDGEAWQRLGRLYLDLGRFDESVIAFDKAATFHELSNEGQVWYADALFRSGRENEAREYLRGYSLSAEVDPFVFLQAAILQRKISDVSGALVTLLKALEVEPGNGELNYQTGLLLSVSDPDQGLPFLKNAATFSPSRAVNSKTLLDLICKTSVDDSKSLRFIAIGQELATIQEWDVAQMAFEKAVTLDATNAEAWALLAEARQQNGEEGRDFITQALKLDPGVELVNGLSGLYYRRQGNFELALDYLQKAASLNPAAYVWEIEIANTYDTMGNLSSALEHHQNATRIAPNDWQPWRALAEFCLTRNLELEDLGVPAARKALELYDNSPALMDLLGTVLMTTGDLNEALTYFQLADQIDPNQTPILIHIGQLYLLKDDLKLAGEYLRLAREYAKDERLRDLAVRLLLENGLME